MDMYIERVRCIASGGDSYIATTHIEIEMVISAHTLICFVGSQSCILFIHYFVSTLEVLSLCVASISH